MGCNDRDDDYNAHKYYPDKGKWYVGLSYDQVSIEAPTKEMVLEYRDQHFPSDDIAGWDVVELPTGGWKATRKELLSHN